MERPASPMKKAPDFRAFGIPDEDIRAVCFTDLDRQCRYRYGWLVLTDREIVRITAQEIREEMDFCADGAPDALPSGCQAERFALSDCGEMEEERQVACLLLRLTVGGEAQLLAVASNSRSEDICRFARRYAEQTGRSPRFAPPPRRRPGGAGRPDKNRAGVCPRCGTPYRPGTTVCPRCSKRSSVLFRLLGFFKPYAGRSVLTLITFILMALMSLITPYLNGNVLYGNVLRGRDALGGLISPEAQGPVMALLLIVLTMLSVKVLNQFFNFLQSYVVARFVPFVIKDIKSKVFDAMSRLSLRFYQSRETGTLMTRVLDDAHEVTDFFIDSLPSALIDGVTVCVAFVIMFSLNWQLTLTALVLLPLSASITLFLVPAMWKMYGRRHRASRSMNSQINDNLTGARVVRAFGTEANESERFVRANRRVGKVETDIGGVEAWLHALFAITKEMIALIVYAVGAWLVLSREGNMDYALLITFTGYVGMLTGPVETLSRFVRQFVSCLNCSQRIFEIIDAKPDVEEAENPVHLETIRGDLEFEHVGFSYEKGKPVLKDICLSVRSGEHLGVVGPSGAGKSTLLNLISRLYDPDEGRITLDGVDIRDLSFKDLHGRIAMVSQETYIFMGTVAENIAYARPDATHDEIVAAAIAASAHDFIMQLPDGYDTVIGPAGRELSGGERQRLSIARAILTDPKILILDEATASVDTETEIHIQLALERLIQNRTTISVAHRLSTLRDADRLVVIEDGRIVERGTHTELMKQRGTYYRLATIQSQAMSKWGILE